MQPKRTLILFFFICLCHAVKAQDNLAAVDKVINFPTSFLNNVQNKYINLEDRLTRQTEKNLLDLAKRERKSGKVPESVVPESYDSVFLKKPLVECKLIHTPEQKEENDFLNSNIAFFEVQSLPEQRLINEHYCRFVLEKTHFLFFEESSFKPGNFEFSHFYTNIDQYGKCFIGKFYFPAAVNSAQRRVVIILQMDIKELVILNFDDVKFVGGKLNCDFNVRGKHTFYKLKYSKECKRFIN